VRSIRATLPFLDPPVALPIMDRMAEIKDVNIFPKGGIMLYKNGQWNAWALNNRISQNRWVLTSHRLE
jgi:hypothetical protein